MEGISTRNFLAFLGRRAGARTILFCGYLVAMGSTSHAFGNDAVPADEFAKREKLQELYQQQIPLMENYLEKNPNGDRAALFLFRLGEAYFESAKFAQISEQSSRAQIFTNKAVESLEKLRRNYPTYERMDEALLVLATTYLERGDEASAGPVLADIGDRFPNSPIMAQASYLLGDYYYNQGRLAQAATYYQKATAHEKAKAYAFYKLAWIAIKQSRPGLALKNFEKVLEINSKEGDKSFDYSRDAAREMVWPALEVYKASRVISYLEKIMPSQDLLKSSLTSFGSDLIEKDEFRLSSEVYSYLINRFPGDASTADWIAGQLKAEEQLGRSSKIVELVSKLNSMQGSQGDTEKLQSQIYSSAKKYHALAQKEKEEKLKAKYYDQAIAYYRAFDQLGLTGPKSAETKFYEGEALYARGQYAEAVDAYEAATLTPNDKSADALWSLYLTTEKLAPGFQYSGKELQQTTPMDEKFLAAARQVAQSEALSFDKRRKASYQSARLLYQLNDFERSLPIFKALAEQYPTSEEGKLSAQLVLDIYNLRNDYKSVAEYARSFQSSSDSKSKSELTLIEQKATFKTIQENEERAKQASDSQKPELLKQVADQYMQFARQYPTSTLVDSSVWAAIQLYATSASMSGDKSFQALRSSFDLLSSRYSKSKYLTQAINLMGEFLALQKADPSILGNYLPYRSQWLTLMKKETPSKRGVYGQMLYEMSNEAQKRALENEFASLPVSPENRKLIALYRIRGIRASLGAYKKISLSSLSALKTNTQKKLNALDRFKNEVTEFVKLGDPTLAVESLNLLAGAYSHMAQEMRGAPIPKALQGADKEKYQMAVEEKARSFDVQSQEARALAQKTAIDLGEGS